MREDKCPGCQIGSLDPISYLDTCINQNNKKIDYYIFTCNQCLNNFIGPLEQRIDKKMLSLVKELSHNLEQYIYYDYTDNYQEMLNTRANIGSYITELRELLNEF